MQRDLLLQKDACLCSPQIVNLQDEIRSKTTLFVSFDIRIFPLLNILFLLFFAVWELGASHGRGILPSKKSKFIRAIRGHPKKSPGMFPRPLPNVPKTRVELARANAHHPLKVACLPIPPPGLICGCKNTTFFNANPISRNFFKF